MDLELTGPQFRSLSEAIRATMKVSQFDRLLKEYVGINREDIALGDDYTDIVFKVIDAANRQGWVYKLVDAARQERPGYATFVEYAALLGIAPQGLPDQSGLERIIKKSNALLNIATFRSRIGEIEGQVCRIDCQGRGLGTGFLMGPDRVLTNYHVIEDVVKGKHSLSDFTCRFDYKMRPNGSVLNPGVVVKLKSLLTYSPYDPADLKQHAGLPDASHLDYAVLILEREIGHEPIGDKMIDSQTPSRGWMTLPTKTYDFKPDTPLFIVQHPDAAPMKLALDTEAIIGRNGNGTRVTYRTNTEPGSSGSPCFNQEWELVALHHGGDPKWLAPTWNRGIPIALVAAHLKGNGFVE